MFLRALRSFSMTAYPWDILARKQIGAQMNRPPKALRGSMESHACAIDFRSVFWGLRFDADGIVAIAAALLIVLVFALLLAVRF